jgi:7-keto-8-aminopelargonate synthetase-like enzyme
MVYWWLLRCSDGIILEASLYKWYGAVGGVVCGDIRLKKRHCNDGVKEEKILLG